MKNKLLLLLFLILILTGAAFGQQRKLVGELKYETGASCGDYFSFADTEKLIFFSSAGDENDTWMNIDGKEVQLKLVSRTEPNKVAANGGPVVGSRHIEKYAAGNITVEIIFIVDQVCEKNDESCESTGYRAVFKVRKGRRLQIVKAGGVSGC